MIFGPLLKSLLIQTCCNIFFGKHRTSPYYIYVKKIALFSRGKVATSNQNHQKRRFSDFIAHRIASAMHTIYLILFSD